MSLLISYEEFTKSIKRLVYASADEAVAGIQKCEDLGQLVDELEYERSHKARETVLSAIVTRIFSIREPQGRVNMFGNHVIG